MKKAGLLLLAVFLMTIKPSLGQERNKEVMIKKIFAVLAEKDEEGFVNLFPDAKTLKEYMLKALNADTSAKENSEVKAFLEGMEDSTMQLEFRESYFNYIRLGEEKGVDWLKTKFVSYTVDSVQIEEDGISTPMLKGKIYFTVDTTKYFLAFDEVIWFENKGWYGVNVERIDVVAREKETDVYDWDGKIVDSTLQVMDSVVAATIADSAMTTITEVPVTQKKTDKKKPEKNKSTKKKSDSPIRKPE